MVAGADSGERAGERAPVRATFQEVDVPARLVFTNQALDADGNVDLDGTTTVLFDDLGDGTTRVTVRASAEGLTAGAAQMLAGMQQGWDETVDKLADFVRAAASRQRPARP
jgi:uncharacterized protein YndB with AHSA1/START domain